MKIGYEVECQAIAGMPTLFINTGEYYLKEELNKALSENPNVRCIYISDHVNALDLTTVSKDRNLDDYIVIIERTIYKGEILDDNVHVILRVPVTDQVIKSIEALLNRKCCIDGFKLDSDKLTVINADITDVHITRPSQFSYDIELRK